MNKSFYFFEDACGDLGAIEYIDKNDYNKLIKEFKFNISKEVYESLFEKIYEFRPRPPNKRKYPDDYRKEQFFRYTSMIKSVQLVHFEKVLKINNIEVTLAHISVIDIQSNVKDSFDDTSMLHLYSYRETPIFALNAPSTDLYYLFNTLLVSKENIISTNITYNSPYHEQWPYIFILYCFQLKQLSIFL